MDQSTDQAKPAKRRSRGDGSIIETPDGRLRGRVIVPGPDGTPITRWVSGRSRAEVSRKLATIRRDADAGRLGTGETVGAYLARWIEAVGPRLRGVTWRGYRQHVTGHWTPTLGSHELARMTPTDVERAMAKLTERGLSRAVP